jgi:hypothetical protein
MNEIDKIHDAFLEYGIATEEEMNLVTAINGTTVEAYYDILFARTGYRSLGQYLNA